MKKRFSYSALLILLILLFNIGSASPSAYLNPNIKHAPRNLTREEMFRVEGYMNYFADALYRYYAIHGEYPISFKYLLNSGLLVAWPINPLTNKPVRIIKNIDKEDYQYAGDIAYKNPSANEGYFEGIFQTERTGVWKYMKFPDIVDKSAYLKLKKEKPESYSEDPPVRFAKSIVSLFGTLKTLNLDVKERLPETTSELLGNDFRIIREFYNPIYKGTDENTNGFYELGVDLDGGYWYSEYRIWGDYTHKFTLKYPNMGLKLEESEFVDKKVPRLKSPIPLLSPSVYPDFKSLPQNVLISLDDIEFVAQGK
jgi:hypothetical protein